MKAKKLKLVVKPKPRREIKSLVEFFERLQTHTPDNKRQDLYRGHSSTSFRLKPSLFRKQEHRKDEKNIFRELISIHPGEFVQDRNTFEQLVRMQHYSLPTRLLDLTHNPLVAIYFACKNLPSSDGHFVRLSVPKRRVRYFDSDTVSCVAGLSNLTGNERDAIRHIASSKELPKSHAGKRLLQFIRSEKPYFLPEIDIDDLKSIQVVRPKQSNRRIIAQQGAFLLFGLVSELDDDNDFDIDVIRTVIPRSAKQRLLKELDRININESTLFPEIESAAHYIMDGLTPTP
jgi:hypothetical protein